MIVFVLYNSIDLNLKDLIIFWINFVYKNILI